MEMQGSRRLSITKQQAWDALNDPEVLKACIPGCDKVEASGENQYDIGMAVKIGPVSAKFKGKITLSDIEPPDSYTITFEGTGGPAGFGKGNAKVTLDNEPVGCELGYTVQAQVGGKVAQLGQRLIDGAAKSMAEDFFQRFDQEMQRRYPPDDVNTPKVIRVTDAAGDAPASTGIVLKPAKGLARVPMWAWLLGAIIILLIMMVLSR